MQDLSRKISRVGTLFGHEPKNLHFIAVVIVGPRPNDFIFQNAKALEHLQMALGSGNSLAGLSTSTTPPGFKDLITFS